MDDADLQAYREAYRAALEDNGGPAPSDDELAALVTGELTGEERDRVALSMLQSPEAIEKHRILEALHKQRAGARRARFRPFVRAAVGLAAAVALVVFVVELQPSSVDERKHDTVRGTSLSTFPPTGAKIVSPPSGLRWNALPGVKSYRVTIRDAGAVVLWRSEPSARPQIKFPRTVEDRLAEGGAFFWTIEASVAGSIRRLGPYAFEVEPAD